MPDLAPLSGLLLAGGKSQRMGVDKANLRYRGSDVPQWKKLTGVLADVCPRVCISVRNGQVLDGYSASDGALIEDGPESNGPLTGLLRAFAEFPGNGWLVAACDLPLLSKPVLEFLTAHRGESPVIAFKSANDGLPEPLCAIYEPSFLPVLQAAMDEGMRCPRKILINNTDKVTLLELPDRMALENANTPEEFERLQSHLTRTVS
jgi:molybdopterin-guanine dinucleotide biosynthesis protein A